MKEGIVTNKMNRYLFYDDEMKVLAFKKGKKKKKILLPIDYIYTEFGSKKFEAFYKAFLTQHLKEAEFLVKNVSMESVILRENNRFNEFQYQKICYYYIMNRLFTKREWEDIQENSYYQGIDVEMKPIDEFISFNPRRYDIGINDSKACEVLQRKLVKESE